MYGQGPPGQPGPGYGQPAPYQAQYGAPQQPAYQPTGYGAPQQPMGYGAPPGGPPPAGVAPYAPPQQSFQPAPGGPTAYAQQAPPPQQAPYQQPGPAYAQQAASAPAQQPQQAQYQQVASASSQLQPQTSLTGQTQPPGSQAPPDQAISQWFATIDTDRTGELTATELQRALAMGNLNFGLTDVDAMVRAFDTRGGRKLNQQEFSKLHAFLNNIQSSFSYFDRERTRALTADQVVAALKHAGFNLDPPVVMAMMNRHDTDNNSVMSMDEFIRMCLFLQSCVRTFTAFDAARSGRINLDFCQFVYATSHCA